MNYLTMKNSGKPYMGRKKPTGAYNSTAKAYYLVDGDVYIGSQRHLILRLLKYALKNNMTSVITGYDVEYGATGDDDDEIKSVQKYWMNDLLQAPEYHEKLFPFAMQYGIINHPAFDDTERL
jgi:hypothetical protein